MANTKEIKDRMKSIEDTLKITNAMYMISSSKLKKAKKSLEETEGYFYTLQSAMARILRHIPDLESPYFVNEQTKKAREDRTVGFIVVTADKGMAGAYNHNVLKLAEYKLKRYGNSKLFVLGELGRHYFEQRNIKIDQTFNYTVQNPTLNRARNISETVLEMYLKGELDEINIIYTKMDNAISSSAHVQKLLPLEKTDFKMNIPAGIKLENLNFNPSPEVVMSHIAPDYVVGFVYGALVESYSSEQNARMMAMDAASKAAKDMLKELDILYNRARQAAITQEITEVCAGAKAQKRKKRR